VALADGAELTAEHLSSEIHDKMRAYGRRSGAETEDATMPSLYLNRSRPPRASPNGAQAAPAQPDGPPPRPRAPSEQELRQPLGQHRGNVAAVGRHFGKERMQIHRWMKRYGIDPDEYRR